MEIQIELTQGKIALIDEADWDLVRGYRWYAQKGGSTYYAQATISREGGGQRGILMHRLIIGLNNPKIHTDHIDGNGLNNRRDNLRACSRSENMHNRGAYATNMSGFKGVSWHKQRGKWQAQIKFNGKNRHLGLYSTPEEAHQAYCRAAIDLHGDFANFGMAGMEA